MKRAVNAVATVLLLAISIAAQVRPAAPLPGGIPQQIRPGISSKQNWMGYLRAYSGGACTQGNYELVLGNGIPIPAVFEINVAANVPVAQSGTPITLNGSPIGDVSTLSQILLTPTIMVLTTPALPVTGVDPRCRPVYQVLGMQGFNIPGATVERASDLKFTGGAWTVVAGNITGLTANSMSLASPGADFARRFARPSSGLTPQPVTASSVSTAAPNGAALNLNLAFNQIDATKVWVDGTPRQTGQISGLSSGMLAVVYVAHGNGAVYVQAFSENPR